MIAILPLNIGEDFVSKLIDYLDSKNSTDVMDYQTPYLNLLN